MAKINLCFLGLKHFLAPPPPPLTHSGGLIATMRVKLVSSHHEDPYQIIVADAADAVSVNFSGRCKFLQI